MPWHQQLVAKTEDFLNHHHRNDGQTIWIHSNTTRQSGRNCGSYFFRQRWATAYNIGKDFPAFHFFINNYAHGSGLVCCVRFESEVASLAAMPQQIQTLFGGLPPEKLHGTKESQNVGYTTVWRPRIFNPQNLAGALPNQIWCDILKNFILQKEVQQFLTID